MLTLLSMRYFQSLLMRKKNRESQLVDCYQKEEPKVQFETAKQFILSNCKLLVVNSNRNFINLLIITEKISKNIIKSDEENELIFCWEWKSTNLQLNPIILQQLIHI